MASRRHLIDKRDSKKKGTFFIGQKTEGVGEGKREGETESEGGGEKERGRVLKAYNMCQLAQYTSYILYFHFFI